MTLQQLLDFGRAYELSGQQAKDIEENKAERVYEVKPRHTQDKTKRKCKFGKDNNVKKSCYFCN